VKGADAFVEKKIFTLSEANALLPELNEDLLKLQELTSRIQEQYRELQKKKAEYKRSSVPAHKQEDPFFEMEGQIDFMRMEAEMLIDNFTRKGVLLKMINPGLVDFPAIVDGEEVLICWKQGEERITHYHGWHDGFAGRKKHPEA
jgi:hypothetical protein